jgi:hypothetical protein
MANSSSLNDEADNIVELSSVIVEPQPSSAISLGKRAVYQERGLGCENTVQHHDSNQQHRQSRADSGQSCRFCQLSESQDLRFRKESMLTRGWCIHQVNYFHSIFDEETLIALAEKARSPREVDHTMCRERTSCVAFNVDMNNYTSRHAQESCNCEMIPAPYNELVQTIRNGQVPLISITATDTGKLKLFCKRRTINSWYIAISHVWADGLGNPQDNALPLCQLDKLKRELESVQEMTRLSIGKSSSTVSQLSLLGSLGSDMVDSRCSGWTPYAFL